MNLKGFKVFYSFITGIDMGDFRAPFNKKDEHRYSINESRHIVQAVSVLIYELYKHLDTKNNL